MKDKIGRKAIGITVAQVSPMTESHAIMHQNSGGSSEKSKFAVEAERDAGLTERLRVARTWRGGWRHQPKSELEVPNWHLKFVRFVVLGFEISDLRGKDGTEYGNFRSGISDLRRRQRGKVISDFRI